MLITTIDYNDFLGRVGISQDRPGHHPSRQPMKVIRRDHTVDDARVTKIFSFDGLKRVEITEAEAGDIIAISGMEDVDIGETIADQADPTPLPFVSIEEPTISMNFLVNNSPFAGQEGQYVTTRNLGERLMREIRSNVSLRVRDHRCPDVASRVSGRGELHLGILIETMRREGFEFQVSRPEVIFQRIDDQLMEPIEHVIIDVPEEHVGVVMENLGRRKGEMKNMMTSGDNVRLEFLVPARGLLGFRAEFISQTRGTGIMHSNFHGYEPTRATWSAPRAPAHGGGRSRAAPSVSDTWHLLRRSRRQGLYPKMVGRERARTGHPVRCTAPANSSSARRARKSVRVEPAVCSPDRRSSGWAAMSTSVTPKSSVSASRCSPAPRAAKTSSRG